MTSELPLFSIIIPTRGRPRQLGLCLEALTRLHYPRERFEVVVVDDGGDASLEAVAARFDKDIDVKLIAQPHAGPAAARNTGAAHAYGQFLAFCDDDCAPHPDWLCVLARRCQATPAAVVGGRIVNALEDNLFSAASQQLLDYLYGYYADGPKPGWFFAASNLTVPADHFRALGGFDSTFRLAGGEDREFCDRWLRDGQRMIYAPEAVVYHAHVLTAAAFWRQHFNYGRGAYHFHRARAPHDLVPMKVQSFSFYLRLLRYPFSQAPTAKALLLSGLFGIAQMATAAGFFWERGFHRHPVRRLEQVHRLLQGKDALMVSPPPLLRTDLSNHERRAPATPPPDTPHR